MKKTCVVCGKEYEVLRSCHINRQIYCNKECQRVAVLKRQAERFQNDPEYRNRINESAKKWQKKHRKPIICMICGEEMEGNTKRRMHDECVYEDCRKMYEAIGDFTVAQIHRLEMRGYTKKEFVEEYCV